MLNAAIPYGKTVYSLFIWKHNEDHILNVLCVLQVYVTMTICSIFSLITLSFKCDETLTHK